MLSMQTEFVMQSARSANEIFTQLTVEERLSEFSFDMTAMVQIW